MGRKVLERVAVSGNEALKDKIREYLQDNLESLLEDISQLPAKDRVDRRMKLMDYVLPKVQAIATQEAQGTTTAASILDSEMGEDED